MAAVGKKIYSFGGELQSGQSEDKKDMLLFDYATFKWSISPARGDVPELSLIGSGLVALGSTRSTCLEVRMVQACTERTSTHLTPQEASGRSFLRAK